MRIISCMGFGVFVVRGFKRKRKATRSYVIQTGLPFSPGVSDMLPHEEGWGWEPTREHRTTEVLNYGLHREDVVLVDG